MNEVVGGELPQVLLSGNVTGADVHDGLLDLRSVGRPLRGLLGGGPGNDRIRVERVVETRSDLLDGEPG